MPMNISLSCFTSLGSTSTYAQTLLSQGQAPPFAVQADVQTRGLGQRGKSWTSPKGNLYLSIVIPNSAMELKARGLIPLKAANLVCRWLLAKFGFTPRIKWPNDLYFAGKKLAGILCQTSVNSNAWGDLFIGIGINVAQAPDILGASYQSISLAQIKSKNYEVRSLAQSLVDFWGKEWFAASEEEVCLQYSNFSSIPFSFWKEQQGGRTIYHRELGVDGLGSLCLQEFGGGSALHAKEKKLSSANHSLRNVFLGTECCPFLVAFQWQEYLYLAVFADRNHISPATTISVSLKDVDTELDSVLQKLQKSCEFGPEVSWPVACCGLVFLNDPIVHMKFELRGLVLVESPANARLSSGFDCQVTSLEKIRLAAAESWLERKRIKHQVSTNGALLDWTQVLGVADHIDRDGKLVRSLNSIELDQFISDMEQKRVESLDLVNGDEILNLVLHGLMLLAIG